MCCVYYLPDLAWIELFSVCLFVFISCLMKPWFIRLCRCCSIALLLDGPGAAHMLAAAAGLTQRYPEVGQLFEWDEEDRVVIGVYNPDAREPDACNAMASMCWEVHLLTKSVHHDVKLLAQYLVSARGQTRITSLAKSICVCHIDWNLPNSLLTPPTTTATKGSGLDCSRVPPFLRKRVGDDSTETSQSYRLAACGGCGNRIFEGVQMKLKPQMLLPSR